MLLFALFLQKLFSSCTPLCTPPFCPVKPNTYYAKEKIVIVTFALLLED